ncbi:hypothetical protein VTH06DRAFT_599 [Thermothelomyces fergusii]
MGGSKASAANYWPSETLTGVWRVLAEVELSGPSGDDDLGFA